MCKEIGITEPCNKTGRPHGHGLSSPLTHTKAMGTPVEHVKLCMDSCLEQRSIEIDALGRRCQSVHTRIDNEHGANRITVFNPLCNFVRDPRIKQSSKVRHAADPALGQLGLRVERTAYGQVSARRKTADADPFWL